MIGSGLYRDPGVFYSLFPAICNLNRPLLKCTLCTFPTWIVKIVNNSEDVAFGALTKDSVHSEGFVCDLLPLQVFPL